MALNKLNMQKLELRKTERAALTAIVELEIKERMAARFISMIPYIAKKKGEREEQLADLQQSLKEQKIVLELVEDMRKELGIVEEEEKEDGKLLSDEEKVLGETGAVDEDVA